MTNINVLNYYLDSLITEMVLSNKGLSKYAQAGSAMSGITEAVKSYFGSKVNPNDRVGSFLDMIAPGVIFTAFKAMNMTGLGLLFGLAISFFNIDVAGILRSIYEKLKASFGEGKQVTPEHVDNIVQTSVQEHSKPATEEDAEKASQLAAQQNPSDQQQATAQILRDARIVKLAIIELDRAGLSKIAQIRRSPRRMPSHSWFSAYSGKKMQTTNVLSRVLSWIFRVALVSAGLMVGADLLKHFLGIDNSLDGTVRDGKPTGTSVPAPIHQPTQTKFKPNPSGATTKTGIWTESVANDRPSIEAMLINFAKQCYQGLDNLDNIIRSTAGFQVLADRIENYNRQSAGNAMVIIPDYFHSKKDIVDLFIDEVAEKTK